MIEELKAIIEEEVKNELADLRYKMKVGVPPEFTNLIQAKIHALEWVKEQIEKLEK